MLRAACPTASPGSGPSSTAGPHSRLPSSPAPDPPQAGDRSASSATPAEPRCWTRSDQDLRPGGCDGFPCEHIFTLYLCSRVSVTVRLHHAWLQAISLFLELPESHSSPPNTRYAERLQKCALALTWENKEGRVKIAGRTEDRVEGRVSVWGQAGIRRQDGKCHYTEMNGKAR